MSQGKKILYVTLIRRNCKELFWRPLQHELREAGWSFTPNETDLIMRFGNGAVVQAISVDDVRDIPKARGFQWDGVIVDEAQAPGDDVLRPFVDETIIPTLFKTRGFLDLLGTAPDSLAGYFVSAYNSGTWRRLGWSVFKNPHIPAENVREAYEARGIGPGHPIWEREVEGRLVVDPDKLVYPYDPVRNGCILPLWKDEEGPNRELWRFSMGLDLGFQDRDAIVVVGWQRVDVDRHLYVLHEWEQNHLDYEKLQAVVEQVYRTWRPSIIVADHGGHAAQKVLASLEARLKVKMEVKPPDVSVSTGLLADEFRSGRFKAEPTSLVARDAGLVVWSVDDGGKLVPNKKGYHSDILDALRYAHHGARHYAAKAPKPEPTLNQKRDAWAKEKRRRMLRPW